jgi:hypothetical protein
VQQESQFWFSQRACDPPACGYADILDSKETPNEQPNATSELVS